jgi:hypothetical protein
VVLTPVVEPDPGACDEIGDGAGDDDFAGSSFRLHPAGQVDGDPSDVIAASFDFARVYAGAQLQTETARLVSQNAGASDGSCRAVEGGEHPVSGRLDHPAPKSAHNTMREIVVAVE